MSSGTGLLLVTTPSHQAATAFVCVARGNKNKSAYWSICQQLQPKLTAQVNRVSRFSNEYHWLGCSWRLFWGTGAWMRTDDEEVE
eukprot:1172047-Karenia_brevis.AAC.1